MSDWRLKTGPTGRASRWCGLLAALPLLFPSVLGAQTLTSISPTSSYSGTITLTANGSGFDSGAVLELFKPDGTSMCPSPPYCGTVQSRTSTQLVTSQQMTGAPSHVYTVKVRNSSGTRSSGRTLTMLTEVTVTPGSASAGTTFAAPRRGFTGSYGVTLHGASRTRRKRRRSRSGRTRWHRVRCRACASAAEEELLRGVVSVRDLFTAQPHQTLSEIQSQRLVTITPDEHEKEVVDMFAKYGFRALPVVDEENHLKGVIGFRNVLDVLAPDAG